MKDLNLSAVSIPRQFVVIALMEKYGIEDLAEFIESYAHLHVERNEEMKLHSQIEAGHLDR